MHRVECDEVDRHLRGEWNRQEAEDYKQDRGRGQGEEKEHGQYAPHPGYLAAHTPMPKPVKKAARPACDSIPPHVRSIASLSHAGATGAEMAYLMLVDMFVKVVDRFVPTAVTAPMITTAINAAMRPYSMAVAPPSWRANCLIKVNIFSSLRKQMKSFTPPLAQRESVRDLLIFIYAAHAVTN
jgi:hypothetical protein